MALISSFFFQEEATMVLFSWRQRSGRTSRGCAAERRGRGEARGNRVRLHAECLDDRTLPSASVIATIPVGAAPQGLDVNPGTHRAYVANTTSGTVSVINTQTNTVVTTINLGAGSNPNAVGVNTSTNRVFVVEANTDGSNSAVAVIDGVSGSGTENQVIATIPVPGRFVGFARQIAVNPATNRVYVPSFDPGGQVEVIDGSNNTLTAQISVAANPISAAVDPATNTITIGHGAFFHRNQLTIINGANNAVSDGPAVGLSQAGLGVDSATHRLYVHKGDTSRSEPVGVVVVNTMTNTVLSTITPGTAGQNVGFGNVAVNTHINRVYVAEQDPAANDVAIVNGAPGGPTTDTQVATVAVGTQPIGVGVDTTSGLIYVSNAGSNTVSVIADIPDHVYVNNNFANPAIGQDPDGAGPATDFGFDSFATIQAGVNAVAPAGTVTVYGGTYPEAVNISQNETVQLNDSNAVTINALTGVAAAVVDLSSGTVTVGDATSTTYNGSIIGSGNLTKNGTGTLTLSGNNTYTGLTDLDGGTLTVSGALNNNAVPTAGLVNLNTTGVTLNGNGTIKGQVTVNASSNVSQTSIQAVTVAVPTTSGGTGITVVPGARFVQIGVTGGGVTVNRLVAANTGTVGIAVLGSARIENSTIGDPATATKGHHIGVLVDGGGAAAVGGLDGVAELQFDHVDNDAASGGLDSGLQVQNSGIVDAGQLAPSATFLPNGPAGNVGYYGDITGLFSGTPLGSTAHSSGNNTFNGYTLDTSATATPNPGPAIPQAIRDLDSGAAAFGPLANGVEQSFNYGSAGPQLGRMDVTAQGDTFNGSSSLPLFQIEQLIFHDIDDNGVGFVSYGNLTAPAPVVVGNVTYSANITLSATQGGTSTLLAGAGSVMGDPNFSNGQKSIVRNLQVTYSSYVFLDPNLQTTAANAQGQTNRGLNLVELNGPSYQTGNTSVLGGRTIHATVVSTVYNRTTGAYTVVYAFSGPGTESGSLEDGNYSLQLIASAIQGGGPGGPGLATAGDPFATAAAQFWRFFGDSNGNRVVDNSAVNAFLAAYRSRRGFTANYRAYFDFNNDGYVDSVDNYQLQRRRNFNGMTNPHGYMLNPDGTVAPVP
jgi:autotransporter-associated beta strand protein/YVTN family beta-propeller protein